MLGDWPDDVVPQRDSGGALPDGAHWALGLVDTPQRLRGAFTALLAGVVVVDHLDAALDLVATRPQLRAVTADGDIVGAGWVNGGSDRKPSTLEIVSEIEKARTELEAVERQTGELSAALSGALAEQSARQDSAEQALAALNESDAAISSIYEQLGRLGQDARAAAGRMAAAERSARRPRGGPEAHRRGTHRARTPAAHRAAEPPFDFEPVDRQESTAAAEAARVTEVEARFSVRTAEERANAVRGRADSLRRAAATENARPGSVHSTHVRPGCTPQRWRPRLPRPDGWSRHGSAPR